MTTIYHEQGFDEDKYFGVQVVCPDCEGQGYVVQTRYVTKDMATDACAPEMEGMPIPDQIKCWKCNGDGWIVSTQITKDDDEIPY